MIRDEDLRSSLDYSEGQKKAAHRVLVELVNIFSEYEEEVEMIKRDAYEQVQALLQLI